jgi:hypothetical protein
MQTAAAALRDASAHQQEFEVARAFPVPGVSGNFHRINASVVKLVKVGADTCFLDEKANQAQKASFQCENERRSAIVYAKSINWAK